MTMVITYVTRIHEDKMWRKTCHSAWLCGYLSWRSFLHAWLSASVHLDLNDSNSTGFFQNWGNGRNSLFQLAYFCCWEPWEISKSRNTLHLDMIYLSRKFHWKHSSSGLTLEVVELCSVAKIGNFCSTFFANNLTQILPSCVAFCCYHSASACWCSFPSLFFFPFSFPSGVFSFSSLSSFLPFLLDGNRKHNSMQLSALSKAENETRILPFLWWMYMCLHISWWCERHPTTTLVKECKHPFQKVMFQVI